jgi:hypothetical protein
VRAPGDDAAPALGGDVRRDTGTSIFCRARGRCRAATASFFHRRPPRLRLPSAAGLGIGEVVEPGTELGLQYTFYPRGLFEPMSAQVALTVFYEDNERYYTTTFYNETVTFTSAGGSLTRNVYLVLPYVLGLLVAGAGVYVVYQAVWGKQPLPKAFAGPETDDEEEEEDAALSAGGKKQAGKAAKPRSANKQGSATKKSQ